MTYEVGLMLLNQPPPTSTLCPKHSGLIQQPFIIFYESAGQFWCGPGVADLAGLAHVTVVSWWVNYSWPAWAGLGWLDSSAVLHMTSHPPAAYPGLVLMMVAGVQESKRKHACDYPTGQSKLYSQALSWGRTAYPKRMDLGRHEQMGAANELHLLKRHCY